MLVVYQNKDRIRVYIQLGDDPLTSLEEESLAVTRTTFSSHTAAVLDVVSVLEKCCDTLD